MFPRTARRSVMDPTTTFCPNRNCPARGQTSRGNIGVHSRKEQRFICHACHKTFSATTGTVFYRLPLRTLVSAKSGSFPLSKAPGQECYEAFLTPMPLHTLGQMCSHRRLFPQWACRHGDLGKIHAQQHPTQAPTRRTAAPIPKVVISK